MKMRIRGSLEFIKYENKQKKIITGIIIFSIIAFHKTKTDK
jgi:hypothetical protein